jgi:serine protease Do
MGIDPLVPSVIENVQDGSPAARGGIQPGDVVLEVNRQVVASARDASRELEAVAAGEAAFILVWRRGQEVFLTVTKE